MQHVAVILNGPPGVGKDTLAEMLEEYGFAHCAFKHQLYADTAIHYELDYTHFVAAATDRKTKEEPYLEYGMTPRDMLIHVSENVMKPQFGEDYFGKAAAMNCLMQGFTLVVFSDGGFGAEVEQLDEFFNHTIVVRLQREGYSFGGDSRTYLHGFEKTYDLVVEEGAPENTLALLLGILEPYVNELSAVA